jgi:hypothetical protein
MDANGEELDRKTDLQVLHEAHIALRKEFEQLRSKHGHLEKSNKILREQLRAQSEIMIQIHHLTRRPANAD